MSLLNLYPLTRLHGATTEALYYRIFEYLTPGDLLDILQHMG
jgi:hypothetical protein